MASLVARAVKNQARVFPKQVRLLVLLWRWAKSQAVLCVQALNSPRNIGCALGGFPGQIGWRLYLVISKAMDYTPCLGIAGEAAVKMLRFFVVLRLNSALHVS